jgi:hypothetical protein
MLGVDLDGSRRIWAAHVGWRVSQDGLRRIQLDRLDDHLDDQAPSDGNRMARPGRELGELAAEQPVENGRGVWTHVGSAEIA